MRAQIAILALLLLIPGAVAGDRPGALRGFSALELLEIENTRNEQGQKLPDELIPDLRQQLLHGLVALHTFHRVEDHVDDAVPSAGAERVVQLKVKITGYSGAQNQAGVKSEVFLIDKASGQEVFRSPVNAQLRYDQGAATSATRKLARSIANLVRDSR
ncbi:MAG TPA: hypothetical protein VMS96_14895 [Terriglobales bacterium]|nr:hypothetical protein [Terriglobales bacterium]